MFFNEKSDPTRSDKGAMDFYFPPRDIYIISYATDDGRVMYFKTGDYRVKPWHPQIVKFGMLDVKSNIIARNRPVANVESLSATLLLRLGRDVRFVLKSYKDSSIHAHGYFEEFDRMHKYESFLKHCHYLENQSDEKALENGPPPPFLFDALINEINDMTMIWSFPNIDELLKPETNPITKLDYKSLKDFETPIFKDHFWLYLSKAKRWYSFDDAEHVSQIRNTLNMRDEPMLYQMAQFHKESKNSENNFFYFIGTFRQALSDSSFTTILTFNRDNFSLSINESFGDKGKIYGFKVNIDSIPIVDPIINCVVVLSFTEPRLLVICLETFSHFKLDLRDWTTEGFLDRWERNKRRICMTFLSHYKKLVFFPRYTREECMKKSRDEKFTAMSTMVNWKAMKNESIIPFLNKKRTERRAKMKASSKNWDLTTYWNLSSWLN